MKVLRSRLAQIQIEQQEAEVKGASASKMEIAFGSQIRSYVMHPYQMVKDHRTSEETSNVPKVMEGDLQNFIRAYLLKSTSEEKEAERDE